MLKKNKVREITLHRKARKCVTHQIKDVILLMYACLILFSTLLITRLALKVKKRMGY